MLNTSTRDFTSSSAENTTRHDNDNGLLMILKQACQVLAHLVQYAFKDSMTHRSCKSHYISHFAAFFIDARAKRSIVKSLYDFAHILTSRKYHPGLLPGLMSKSDATPREQHQTGTRFVNDPSAGSPTETLLRLLLPLNDQVCPTSPGRNALRRTPPSGGLTKPFNR
jgi:hypothetical protein